MLASKIHSTLVHRLRLPFPFSFHNSIAGSNRRVLILSHDHPICHSQIYPFRFYQRQLRERYGVDFVEQNIEAFLGKDEGCCERADIVLIQPWFTVGDDGLERLLDAVERRCASSRVVFFDSYAPADLRFAKTLNDRVDLYVKKHVLRDRALYGKSTLGDTNLTDFFSRRFDLNMPTVTFDVPEGFLDKMIVGPSFATADYMLRRFLGTLERPEPLHDVHARLGRKGTPWYEALREESIAAIEGVPNVDALSGFGVPKPEFLKELSRTRLCFSPFGYGEVAWRDYEAVMCGGLLLKQDMAHLETAPDIFMANETYVSLKWDLSDLEEKVRFYLDNENERLRISGQAFHLLHNYFEQEKFVEQVARIFD